MYNDSEIQQRTAANSMLTFLLGAAVGASVMLLCSPASGKEVRSTIAEKATEIKDRAGEWTGHAVDKAAEWKDKAMETAHDTLERAADSFNRTDGKHPADRSKEFAKA